MHSKLNTKCLHLTKKINKKDVILVKVGCCMCKTRQKVINLKVAVYKPTGKVKKKKKKKEKTASVAAGELCPVKTEDVWLRGDSSKSK